MPASSFLLSVLLSVVALGATVSPICGQEERQNTAEYRQVYAGDLVGGCIQPGERVELKTNLPSAQAALPIDVNRPSSEVVRQLREHCVAENEPLTVGGCTSRIRGQVTPPVSDKRPGLLADAIVVREDER